MIVGGVVAVLIVGSVINRLIAKTAAEKMIEAATGGKAQVNTDNGEVTVKTDQGTYSTSDKIPANFPSDVPVYPGAKVQSSVATSQEQGNGHYLGLETSDSLDTVTAWYKSQVVDKGWKIESDATINGTLILGATKDTRQLSVSVSDGGSGKVAITLVVATK